MALLHRLDRLLARRVEQANKTEQDKISRQVGRSEAARLHPRIFEPSKRQHALALAGELVGGAHKERSIDRFRLIPGSLLPITVFKDDFGRALDEEDLPTVRGLVQRRHELVLRL